MNPPKNGHSSREGTLCIMIYETKSDRQTWQKRTKYERGLLDINEMNGDSYSVG